MSNPTPDPTSSSIAASSPAAGEPAPSPHLAAAETGNLPLAAIAGSIAALIGGALWAVITVVTEYQIGFMAVGVGFLVGTAVGKFGGGNSTPFRVTGAALSLFGCVLGNFLTIVGFASRGESAGFFATLLHVNFAAVPGVMVSAFSPMDLLFYGIALYEGFKLSARH